MDTMLDWLYGKSDRNRHIRQMAERTIELLKEGPMGYLELAKELGIKTRKSGNTEKPKRQFYKVVNPLKEACIISSVKVMEDKGYRTEYMLSPAEFRGYMKKLVRDVSAKIEIRK